MKKCKGLTLEDCQLAVIGMAVEDNENAINAELYNNPMIKEVIEIIEEFLINKKLICYGGTAINAVLPEKDKFYKNNAGIPDYDFFTNNALEDTKELVDIYYKRGFNVSAKSGVHYGTYKVYVDYSINIADITQIHDELFEKLSNECMIVNGIRFCPPNFLRMSMYLELSRPRGDIERWEKVLKRLQLLNKNYTINITNCKKMHTHDDEVTKKVFEITKSFLFNEDVVIFGGYAISLFLREVGRREHVDVATVYDFDILCLDSKEIATKLVRILKEEGIDKVVLKENPQIIGFMHDSYSVLVNDVVIAGVYTATACHNYNVLKIDSNIKIKVATIDTILSFYLLFLYSSEEFYDKDRLYCFIQILFKIQNYNIMRNGLLHRFGLDCYGKQETLKDIIEKKAKMSSIIKKKHDMALKNKYFFNYNPTKDKKYKHHPAKKRKVTNKKKHVVKKVRTKANAKKATTKTKKQRYFYIKTKNNKSIKIKKSM